MRVKICGITKAQQGQAIAKLGATDLGFICYPPSPRYLSIEQMTQIIATLPDDVGKIGVFVNEKPSKIVQVVQQSHLTGVQLHGQETPDFCQEIRQLLPQIEIIKALRVENSHALNELENYDHCIDTLLLDAYHPQLLGGTGHTLDWHLLQNFKPSLPWFLAGGLTVDNIDLALSQVSPQGIDLSSGVEISPGDKDLEKVAQLLHKILSIH